MNSFHKKRNIILTCFTLLCMLTIFVLFQDSDSLLADILVVACFILGFGSYLLIRSLNKKSQYRVRKVRWSSGSSKRPPVKDRGKVIEFPDAKIRQKLKKAKEK